MPNEIVQYTDNIPENRQQLELAACDLARVTTRPGLADAAGGKPRTIIIARILAGASESDLLLSALLCLPADEQPVLGIIGEPRGPAFKTHPEHLTFQSATATSDDVAEFLNWRMTHSNTTALVSFDATAGAQLLNAVQCLRTLDIPTDVIFLHAKNEGRPGLLDALERLGPVIRMRPAAFGNMPTEELAVPALPQRLVEPYRNCEASLRGLSQDLPIGSLVMFASEMKSFADAFARELSR